MVAKSFIILVESSLLHLGRGAGMLLGSVFSPGLWLSHQLLSPYLDLSPAGLASLQGQMRALGHDVLLHHILPMAVLCLLVSIGTIWAYSRLGVWLTSRVFQRSPLKGHPRQA